MKRLILALVLMSSLSALAVSVSNPLIHDICASDDFVFLDTETAQYAKRHEGYWRKEIEALERLANNYGVSLSYTHISWSTQFFDLQVKYRLGELKYNQVKMYEREIHKAIRLLRDQLDAPRDAFYSSILNDQSDTRRYALQSNGLNAVDAPLSKMMPNASTNQRVNSALFNDVSRALVIIRAGDNRGSGFIANIDGTKYLITNEHVTRGGRPLRVTNLSGVELSLESIEVARDRDLARLKLTNQEHYGLTFDNSFPAIDSSVWVFGNSDGAEVATSLSGTILGIGPKYIEVSAAFVSGNSGSPILSGSGDVLGIATFAYHDNNPADWVKQGTRFTEVRRFGVRLQDTEWEVLSKEQYFTRAEALNAIEVFCNDLYKLRFTEEYYPKKSLTYTYTYSSHSSRYGNSTGLCRLLCDAVDSFNVMMRAAYDEYVNADQAKKSKNRIVRDHYERAHAIDAMQKVLHSQKHAEIYSKIGRDSRRYIARNDWLISRLKDDARYWTEVIKLLTE